MKKRQHVIPLLLAAALISGSVSGCTKTSGLEKQTSAKDASGASVEAQAVPGLETGLSVMPSDYTGTVLLHHLVTEETATSEDYETGELTEFPCATGSYPEIQMASPENLPEAFLASLEDINKELKENALRGFAIAAWYCNSDLQPYTSYNKDVDFYVDRADDTVFCALITDSSFYGGAHPFTDYLSKNISVADGKQLALSDVLSSGTRGLAEEIMHHIDVSELDYEFTEEDYNQMLPILREKLSEEEMEWTFTEKGITFWFDAYDLMYYAFGPLTSEFTYEECASWIKEEYLPKETLSDPASRFKQDNTDDPALGLTALRDYLDEDEREYVDQNMKFKEAEQNLTTYEITAPAWGESFCAQDVTSDLTKSPIVLNEVEKEETDWLDQDAWSERTGIELPTSPLYWDEAYYYNVENYDGRLTLRVSDGETDLPLVAFDLSGFLNPPDTGNSGFEEFTETEVLYQKAVNNILYVALGHRTYAAAQPHTGYILAIDMETGKLLWKSEEQVMNAYNFILGKDTLIAGYGFTDEPDYIYVLDLHTGKILEQRKVATGPNYFIETDDALYVLTYNTAYTYHVTEAA